MPGSRDIDVRSAAMEGRVRGDAAERAKRLLHQSFVWDTHSGFMPDPRADLGNLSLWRDADVDFLSINVGFDLMPWQDSVATIATFRHWLKANEACYLIAGCFADIELARTSGRMAVAFDLEGMVALDGRIEMVGFYRDLGVRQMLFAYNRNNAAGGGCHDDNRGLTAFGRDVVAEMNRVGMTVDVSHCSYRTSMEAMAASGAPVVFSHSNPRSVHRHGRNITDEHIRACAATGGIVGAVGLNFFLGERADAARLADHIDYLIDTAGPDHVALGLDYGFPVESFDMGRIVAENPQFWPKEEGYHDRQPEYVAPADIPVLIEELLCRGHPEAVVRGLLGENAKRVARETWR